MIALADCHDEAYYEWRDAGVQRGILIHLDAHHDIERSPDGAAINIGNYIRAAIREGMVARVWWIVPDPMWDDPFTRACLVKELEHASGQPAHCHASGITATIEGIDVRTGPLASLEPQDPQEPPVLLDIDLDYLMTERRIDNGVSEPRPVPWLWPYQLTRRLQLARIAPQITTIATSVTGGFTPLAWAHLGRELAGRLDGSASPAMCAAFAHLRGAAAWGAGGDRTSAEVGCRQAVAVCPGDGAPYAHLAWVLQAAGKLDEARDAFRMACTRDPFFDHPFRTRGPLAYRAGRLTEAARAYRDGLALDPDDAHAWLGLALIAVEEGHPTDAEALIEAHVLGALPDSIDVVRTLARVRAARGALPAAIDAYTRAMTLALHGAVPLTGPWSSNRDRRLIDPQHWQDHAAVGDLHARLGDPHAAIAYYQIAAGLAPDVASLRDSLARLREQFAVRG